MSKHIIPDTGIIYIYDVKRLIVTRIDLDLTA